MYCDFEIKESDRRVAGVRSYRDTRYAPVHGAWTHGANGQLRSV